MSNPMTRASVDVAELRAKIAAGTNGRCERCEAYGYHEAWCSSLIGGPVDVAALCGCDETYPQLQPGRINHGPGCSKENAMDQSEITISLLTVREKQATDMCTWLTQENERLRGLLTPADVAPFSRADGSVVGPNLRFDDGALVEPERQSDVSAGKEIILDAIVDMLNGAYRSGHDAAQLTKDTALRDLEAVRVELGVAGSALQDIVNLFDPMPHKASPHTARMVAETARSAHLEVRADRDNLRALLKEACGIAWSCLPTVPCDMSAEGVRLAAIAKEGGV